MNLETLKLKSKGLDAVVTIGKNGLTFAVLEQIKQILKKKKLIKIKLSRGFVESQEADGKKKKDIGAEIADATDSFLVNVVGFTVSVARHR
jgi:RNA-binding protein YhbY